MQSAVSEEYVFNDTVLTDGFPVYLQSSITVWLRALFEQNALLEHNYQENSRIVPSMVAMLERNLRREVPHHFCSLTLETYEDEAFGVALLNLLLRNYGEQGVGGQKFKVRGELLEHFLRTAGSSYMSAKDIDGKWGIFKRVNDITISQSKMAIEQDKHLKKAWDLCYGVNPSPSESIKEATNAMEGLFKSQYFNNETKKITFGQMLRKVKDKGFSFAGSDTMVDSPEELLDLMKKFTKKRGEHVENGCGYGTYDEAVYVLHTAIYVWTLCNS